MKQRFDWTDIGYSGVADDQGHAVVWAIHEIVEWDGDVATSWWKLGEISAWPPTTDTDDAHTIVEIYAKFDGCSHYSWADGEATHTCDWGVGLTAMLQRVHEQSKLILGQRAML